MTSISSTGKTPVNVNVRATIAKVATKDQAERSQPAKPQPEPSAKVTISSAAASALVAAQAEALETPQQTVKEARGNDHQAQRLVAKEASRKAHQS